MTDKLSLYNLALSNLGQRRLASLADPVEPRRAIDDVYDQAVAYCLERKMWNFTYRAAIFEASSDVVPGFGFLHAFAMPNDWVRTHLISAAPTFNPPLLQMRQEAGWWFANVAQIYVQYNSNSPQYGMNLGAWPANFTDYVALRIATQSCTRIAGDAKQLLGPQGLAAREEKAYKIASSTSAMNDPIGFAPMSSWVRARRGFSSGGDNPTGSSLIP